MNPKDGFVISLQGPWGSGKSSVLELTLRYLLQLEMQTANENSIQFEELDEMEEQFLRVKPSIDKFLDGGLSPDLWDRNHSEREFKKACGTIENTELAERYWELFKSVNNNPRTITIRFSPWLIAGNAELASALVSDMARELGEKLGNDMREAFSSLLERISQVLPLAGAAADVATGASFGGLLSNTVDASGRIAKKMTTGPTLHSVREKLRRKLQELQERKVLVVIDDLDRLTPSEAVEMISLVKGLGDLPNVLYLLAFDESRLAQLLETKLGGDGHEYLAKIVQYPIHVPTLAQSDLADLLFADLRTFLPDLNKTDQERLVFVWRQVIRFYISTPRAARRLVNAYAIAAVGLDGFTDPIDLLVLETIRLFEPTGYQWLRQNLDSLGA